MLITPSAHLAHPGHPGNLHFGVEVVLFGHLREEEVDLVIVSGGVVLGGLLYEGRAHELRV